MIAKNPTPNSQFAKKLRPEDLLGLPRQNAAALIAVVDRGLSFDSIEQLERSTGFSFGDLATAAGISRTTLRRRRINNRLTPNESDRLVSVAFTIAQAIELFDGETRTAQTWMLTPSPALGGVAPLHMAGTETGRQEVKNLIGRIGHGVFS